MRAKQSMTTIAIDRQPLVHYLAEAGLVVDIALYTLRHFSPTESERSDNDLKFLKALGHRQALERLVKAILDEDDHEQVILDANTASAVMFRKHMMERGVKIE